MWSVPFCRGIPLLSSTTTPPLPPTRQLRASLESALDTLFVTQVFEREVAEEAILSRRAGAFTASVGARADAAVQALHKAWDASAARMAAREEVRRAEWEAEQVARGVKVLLTDWEIRERSRKTMGAAALDDTGAALFKGGEYEYQELDPIHELGPLTLWGDARKVRFADTATAYVPPKRCPMPP